MKVFKRQDARIPQGFVVFFLRGLEKLKNLLLFRMFFPVPLGVFQNVSSVLHGCTT